MAISTGERRNVELVEARGAAIPALGLGTWELAGDEAERAVSDALELGYRHIDTAQAYGNEARVGRAIEASAVPREKIFLTTKVWPDRYAPSDFAASVRRSLERLRTDHVDLLLLHWPAFEQTTLERTIESLNRARDEGWTRHIGLSNFTTELVGRATRFDGAPIAVNQVEYHPYLDQGAILAQARDLGIAVTAYSPLAHGRVPDDETLAEIGEAHGKSAAQVALRWLVQQEGVAAIPRTSKREHAAENLEIFDFELSDREMGRIGELAEPDGRVIDPAGLAPDWD